MVSIRWVWSGSLGVVLGAGIGFVACGGGLANQEPAASVSSPPGDDEATADLTEHHRHHHHGGVTMFIAMSLDSLGILPEQRAAVERIQADLFARMEPARLAEQNVVLAIADGIAAGAVDRGKVDAAVAQVTNAAGALHDATADALNQLHAVLTPPQRTALIDKVQAHWDVWKRANSEEEQTANDARGGHLAKLAKELGLTPDQVDKVRSSVSVAGNAPARFNPQDVDSHIQAFGLAFEGDTFDAKGLSREGSANAHLAGWGAAHMAQFYEAVDPVLSPEQRPKLSQMLREHANHKEES